MIDRLDQLDQEFCSWCGVDGVPVQLYITAGRLVARGALEVPGELHLNLA